MTVGTQNGTITFCDKFHKFSWAIAPVPVVDMNYLTPLGSKPNRKPLASSVLRSRENSKFIMWSLGWRHLSPHMSL